MRTCHWYFKLLRDIKHKISLCTFVTFHARLFLRKYFLLCNFLITCMRVFAKNLPKKFKLEVSNCSFALRVVTFDGDLYLLTCVELILLYVNFSGRLWAHHTHDSSNLSLYFLTALNYRPLSRSPVYWYGSWSSENRYVFEALWKTHIRNHINLPVWRELGFDEVLQEKLLLSLL